MSNIKKTDDKIRGLKAVDIGFRSAINTELELDQVDIDTVADETSFDRDEIETWLNGLKRKKQIVFYGPPGTGKTYTAKKLAEDITEGNDGFYDLVQFHQSYEYEDFIQGIRPDTEEGDIFYDLQEGSFLKFCKEAGTRSSPCVLILDELNRADVSSVFGELMYLLEYRGPDHSINLAQNSEEDNAFSIPDNVYLIGTMNTADRSIALVDFALRRRFAFVPLRPNYQVIRDHYRSESYDVDDLIKILNKINEDIDDQNFSLGFTYFLNLELREELENVWRFEIEPYLEEYFIDNSSKVQQYKWENVDIDV